MIKKLIAALVLLAAVPLHAEDTDTLAPRLQETAVTLHTESGQGSGVIVTRKGVNYVLTAGHVVAGNRRVTKVVTDSKDSSEVSFKPVSIVKEIYTDGESIGTTSIQADVVAYSSAEFGQDVALVRLRSKITDASVEFYPKRLLSVGTAVVHVGSLEGQDGSNSFTTGSYAQIGRVLFDKVFDQTSCPAFPGSSGGGIYLQSNGQYVGMLVRGSGETFNYIVPIRRLKDWAKAHHTEFLFDPKNEDIDHIKLEDREPVEADSPTLTINLSRYPFMLAPRARRAK
jgi:S1-C subfamily serine protease